VNRGDAVGSEAGHVYRVNERGVQQSADLWSRNIRGLAKKFRVLAIDELRRGMTDAPKDDKDLGLAGQVEHLYQFMRAMQLKRAHLVGISNAGFAMLAVALEHPDVVKTLTWVSVGAAFRTDLTKMQARVAHLSRGHAERRVSEVPHGGTLAGARHISAGVREGQRVDVEPAEIGGDPEEARSHPRRR
jgi:pimeloyl-ACP methyl ester carboxylesterase